MLYCYPAVCLKYTFPYLIPLLSCQVTLFFLILCNERVLFLLFLALSSYCLCYLAGKERYISWRYHVIVYVTLRGKSVTSPGVIMLLFMLLCGERALHLLALSCYCFCYPAGKERYISWRYYVIVSVSLLRNKITFLAVITLLSRSCLCYFAQEKVLLLLFLGIIIFLQCPTSRIMLSLCLAFLIFFTLCTVFVTAFFVLKIYIHISVSLFPS